MKLKEQNPPAQGSRLVPKVIDTEGVLAYVHPKAHTHFCFMKMEEQEYAPRVELGRFIVADPKICNGQPTFKGTRILVWVVLEQLERGMTWKEIVGEWDGKVTEDAISETIAISDLVVKNEPFRGFHAGTRRKLARRTATAVA